MKTNIVTAVVTAYCACKLCCGPAAKGVTASGNKPRQNITIAASTNIPFGSKVIVDSRVYTVQDRLSERYDARFDIYYDKHADAKKFGIKTKTVIVVKPN